MKKDIFEHISDGVYKEYLFIMGILALPRDEEDESRDITIRILYAVTASFEEAESFLRNYIGLHFSPAAWKIKKSFAAYDPEQIHKEITSHSSEITLYAVALVLSLPVTAPERYHFSIQPIYAYSEEKAERVALEYAHEHLPSFVHHIAKIEEVPFSIQKQTIESIMN